MGFWKLKGTVVLRRTQIWECCVCCGFWSLKGISHTKHNFRLLRTKWELMRRIGVINCIWKLKRRESMHFIFPIFFIFYKTTIYCINYRILHEIILYGRITTMTMTSVLKQTEKCIRTNNFAKKRTTLSLFL